MRNSDREAQTVHGKKLGHCNRLLKTGCNNVVGATLLLVVNDIVQHIEIIKE